MTLVEIVVALIVLSAGLLGLAGGTSLAARMAGRGAKAGAAVAFAARRVESLRPGGCAARVPGSDTLFRGTAIAAINDWTFIDAGNSTFHLRVVTTYTASAGKSQTFTSEESFTCLP
jgi:hypothetical protein